MGTLSVIKRTLSKTLLIRVLLIIVFVGYIFAVARILRLVSPNNTPQKNYLTSDSASATAPPSHKLEAEEAGLPIRLKIPKLNIDSAVYSVGLTPGGAMDVRESMNSVAWYQAGPHPGEKGNAVIAGHYGWKDGKTSVFTDLHKLDKGDELYIEDDKRKVISFVVTESRKYDPNADASDVFHTKDGKQHLNLITCDGTWKEALQTYSDRLVIFTDKET